MKHEAHPLGWNRRHLLALAAATAAAGPLGARAQAAPAGFATMTTSASCAVIAAAPTHGPSTIVTIGTTPLRRAMCANTSA